MSGTWGIPYQGSKNSIAEDIIRRLPKGKRFVDLFGGGFAMSHCAYCSGKYESVLYNEYNALLPPLIRDAIDGKYNYNVFKPAWIDRETFHKMKDYDGYIKYIWSFSNSGKEYMFGKDLEPKKRSIHQWCVFNERDEWFNKYFWDVDKYIKTDNIKARRILWKRYVELIKGRKGEVARVQQLERLERLQNLQQLQQLERLQNLQIQQGDYASYEYQDGDVVYCDPPYEGTASYEAVFDHKKFYEWFLSRPYPVYLSSYSNIKHRFEMVWAENKRNLMNGASQIFNYECLYINKSEKEKAKVLK